MPPLNNADNILNIDQFSAISFNVNILECGLR